jgi:hypothetical protein
VVVLVVMGVAPGDDAMEIELSLLASWSPALGIVMAGGIALSWWLFMRLEAVEGRVAEIQLPWSRRAAAPAAAGHPLWQLAKKELRVQQLTFGLMGWYVATTWPSAVWFRGRIGEEPWFIGGAIFWLGLPVVVGSLAIAHERQLGTLSWQLQLPVPAWQQWSVKMGIVFGLALLSGVGGLAALAPVFPPPDPLRFDPAFVGTLGIAAAAVYISSIFRTSLRAVVAANFIGESPQPFIYRPLTQAPQPAVTLHIRSANPEAALGNVRAVVQQMEPLLPLTGVFTMPSILDQALWAPRMGAFLLAIFGGIALLLASIGVYGVMAYLVGQRTRELGIRLALGATRGDIRGLVFRQGVALTAVGVAIGLAAAFGLTRLVARLLVDVSALDPVTFIVIPVILVLAAVLAIYLPARRASRVDPVVALRAN